MPGKNSDQRLVLAALVALFVSALSFLVLTDEHNNDIFGPNQQIQANIQADGISGDFSSPQS